MIRYDYTLQRRFWHDDLLVASNIRTTIIRDGEDDSLLEVLARSLFGTFDIMSMPVTSRKQRPISHSSRKLLRMRTTSF